MRIIRSFTINYSLLSNATKLGAVGFRGLATSEQDLIVVGGGPGGYVAAIKAAQLGMKVACVEGRGTLGGTCLNVGCIPSKALLNSSHKYEDAKKHFADFGINASGVTFDFAKIQQQKDTAVAGLTKGIEGLFKKNKVEYVKGWGKFKSANEIEVTAADGTTSVLKAKNVLIATGSEPTHLPGIPVDEQKIVTSTGALALKKVPQSMVVIGGGYIGLEMGSVYQRLGAQVTVVEFLDNIVPSMDGEIRKLFQRSLQKQGMKFKLGTKVNSATVKGDLVELNVQPSKGGNAETLSAEVVLVSAGRKPFTTNLGLDVVGVKTNQRAQIPVDDKFQTNVPGVYAIGDVIPGPMLAHKAEEDGVACVEMLAGKKAHVNYLTVPSIVYTHPEVASVGYTEEQCKEQGLTYRVGKFSFMANSRARAVGDFEGMVKFIGDSKTDKLLGVTIMGPNAGELIHECALAMEYGAHVEDIARTCHGHPTLSEAIKEAALATIDKPIHM